MEMKKLKEDDYIFFFKGDEEEFKSLSTYFKICRSEVVLKNYNEIIKCRYLPEEVFENYLTTKEQKSV